MWLHNAHGLCPVGAGSAHGEGEHLGVGGGCGPVQDTCL